MTNLTLEKVAELAGVSRSTVSRVINKHESVSAKVRARVLSVIEETGYQPNLAARTLASRRSNIIGLIIPSVVPSVFTDPYFPRLIQGITQGCNANDYTLSLFLFHTKDEEQKLYPRIMGTGVVDGVIIASSVIDDPFIPKLMESGIAFVIIGRHDRIPDSSYVDADNISGAYAATRHLIRLGYKRIATITGPQNMVAGIDRRQGYLTALDDRGRTIEAKLIVEGDFTEAGGYVAMRSLLASQPDAAFVASDAMALGALRAIREANLSVPEDIALVGFDDLSPSTILDPLLTTVRQPIRQMGKQAVEILIDILRNGPIPPRRIIRDTQLVIRDTCGANLVR